METNQVLIQKRKPTTLDELPEENRLSRLPDRLPDRPLAREAAVVQLVRKQNGRVCLRSPPKTRASPTPAQIEARIAFGEAAKKVAGVRNAQDRADFISEQMQGRKFRREDQPKPLPAWAIGLVEQGYSERDVRAAVEAWNGRRQP